MDTRPESEERDDRFQGTGFYAGVILILVVAALLLVFAVQNTESVAVDLLGWQFDAPIFALVIGGGLLAVLVDELIGLLWRRRKRHVLRERAELERFRRERRPAEETPVDETPVEERPVEERPVDESLVDHRAAEDPEHDRTDEQNPPLT